MEAVTGLLLDMRASKHVSTRNTGQRCDGQPAGRDCFLAGLQKYQASASQESPRTFCDSAPQTFFLISVNWVAGLGAMTGNCCER